MQRYETLKTTIGNLSDIDLRLLRIFKIIVESKGISTAERQLNIGRSTISRHLKELENRLGVTLCFRGRSGFKLTEEGLTIYQAINGVLISLDRFCHQVNQINQEMKGKLVIGIVNNVATNPSCTFQHVLQQYHCKAKAVHLEIHALPSIEIEQGVLEGEIHFGVLPTHQPTESLCYTPMFTESMSVFSSTVHPLSTMTTEIIEQKFNQYPLAGLAFNSPNQDMIRKYNLSVSATAYDQEGIALLILTGEYLGFLPTHFGSIFVQRQQMQCLSPTIFDYHCQFSGVYRADTMNDRKVKTLIDIVKQYYLSRVQVI